MPLVISDASTLIHLAALGRLGLLKEFYDKVVVPPSVWREVVEEGKGRAGGVEVERARREGWIEVEAIAATPLVQLLYRDLDAGEAEVIALAVDRRADLVLMDESDARQVAARFGLKKTGVIGILIRAKRVGKVQSLASELDRLRLQAGFWLDERLRGEALGGISMGYSMMGRSRRAYSRYGSGIEQVRRSVAARRRAGSVRQRPAR
jgi:predicted nucleic acid-binding protein